MNGGATDAALSMDLGRERSWSNGLLNSAVAANGGQVRRLAAELAEWIEAFYVRLDAVRQRGFDPVAALQSARSLEDIEDVFAALRDRHTFLSFQPTGRARDSEGMVTMGVLQLPVRIGHAGAAPDADEPSGDACWGGGRASQGTFWITEVADQVAGRQAEGPRRGDQVTHWNGMPIAHVVRRLGAGLRGANDPACFRLGLRGLTRRVTEPGRLPEEDWVVLTCRRADRVLDVRLNWGERHPRFVKRRQRPRTDRIDVVRISHFGAVDEMQEIVDRLREQRTSGRSLLLDLRGNAGGSVHGMLAVFEAVMGVPGSPRLRFQFRASEQLAGDLSRLPAWRRWTRLCEHGFLAPHSLEHRSGGFLSGPAEARRDEGHDVHSFPQRRGALGLLVDASTFSAAEILTAMLRAEGATVMGTDPCTGGGPDNGWSAAALRRLCPETWVEIEEGMEPRQALEQHCALNGLEVAAEWDEEDARHWRLRALSGSASKTARLAVCGPDLASDAVAIYRLEEGIGGTENCQLELQLSVRRPLIQLDGRWVPVEGQLVDHWLRQTRRDLLESDFDLFHSAYRILTGDARVALFGSENPAPPVDPTVRCQAEESFS